MSYTGIIFVKGSVSSWQPQGLYFYLPKGVVGGKSCISLIEQVLKQDRLEVFLTLCLRKKIYIVLINMLHSSVVVPDAVLSNCMHLVESEYSKRRKI